MHCLYKTCTDRQLAYFSVAIALNRMTWKVFRNKAYGSRKKGNVTINFDSTNSIDRGCRRNIVTQRVLSSTFSNQPHIEDSDTL